MGITGNKGEWSELYAFIKLLSTGRLYAADEKLQILEDTYFPVLKVFRCEDKCRNTEYIIKSDDGSVEIYLENESIRTLDNRTIRRMAAYLYASIVAGKKRAFEIDDSESIMKQLECTKISAPSTDKTDIKIQVHDIHTGYEPICGFSIKSELGTPPTLLNASGATNFVFEIEGVSEEEANTINSINTDTKIIDRIDVIRRCGKLKFKKAYNSTFSGNLMLIDTYMEDIIAEILWDYYSGNAQDCKTLVARLEEKNPLGYPRKGIYEYKMKKFLCSIALGMMPSKIWDGKDEANGGYIIVRDDGEVVAYHLYNRDAFEMYLLNNTKLERGSTKKHGFASIYRSEDGTMNINLNLQIRFM